MIEVGVARPIAQGQAMINTATALTSASVSAGAGPTITQTRKVSIAIPITTGTKYRVTRSTRAWIGSLEPCAASTMRMIWDNTVSLPTRVAAKVRLPCPFTVPPTTFDPVSLSTGTGSPVIMDSSTQDEPSRTSPSTGSRSPGRTSTWSPGRSCSASSSSTSPARVTRAVRGRRPMSLRMASEVSPRARASRKRPTRIRVMMTAEASK
jgi:hypothetical protein